VPLNFHYETVDDLLQKLNRERDRVFEAVKRENTTEMCDFFFNFCITAHSLRDWMKKTDGFDSSTHDIHEICNEYPALEACRDIANSHKHFDFETERKTPNVTITTSKMVDVYQREDGHIHLTPPRDNVDIGVILSDCEILGLWEFMGNVVNAWDTIIGTHIVKA
jgi:hypothetical protein